MRNIFSILDYGAKRDAQEPQTTAIQSAIDACFCQGGGEVQIPDGTFYTGGIRLRSNVCLHLLENARLKGVRDAEAYDIVERDTLEPLPNAQRTDALFDCKTWEHTDLEGYAWERKAGARWNHALIRAVYAKNVSIIGEKGSMLDGSNCFYEKGEEYYRGPHLVNIFCCENIVLRGYTCIDSSNWAHCIFFSGNILVEYVQVIAGHDGVNARGCDNITIQNCAFYSGDDCVAGMDDRNLLVRDCLMNTACSAMRLSATNAIIERCKLWGPGEYVFRGSLSMEEKRSGAIPKKLSGHRYNMLNVLTYLGDYSMDIRSMPGNIVIRDCEIKNVDRFIQYDYSGKNVWQTNRPLRNITFERIKAEGISMPLVLYGSVDTPLYFALRNSEISFADGLQNMDFIQTCNYAQILLENVRITGLSGGALVRSWGGDGELICQGLVCAIPKEHYLLAAEEPFECKRI